MGPREAAAQKSVDAMEAGGLLEDADAATIDAVIGLAQAVDENPGNASLWDKYLAAISDLRSLNDGGGDQFNAAMAGLFASVQHPEKPREAESDG